LPVYGFQCSVPKLKTQNWERALSATQLFGREFSSQTQHTDLL
jgi:hypothetical protein